MDCCTIPCGKMPNAQRRRVVWKIDGRYYCNSCFLDWCEANEIRREKIVRLYDNEELYEDVRRQKRRGRKQHSSICTGTTHAVQA